MASPYDQLHALYAPQGVVAGVIPSLQGGGVVKDGERIFAYLDSSVDVTGLVFTAKDKEDVFFIEYSSAVPGGLDKSIDSKRHISPKWKGYFEDLVTRQHAALPPRVDPHSYDGRLVLPALPGQGAGGLITDIYSIRQAEKTISNQSVRGVKGWPKDTAISDRDQLAQGLQAHIAQLRAELKQAESTIEQMRRTPLAALADEYGYPSIDRALAAALLNGELVATNYSMDYNNRMTGLYGMGNQAAKMTYGLDMGESTISVNFRGRFAFTPGYYGGAKANSGVESLTKDVLSSPPNSIQFGKPQGGLAALETTLTPEDDDDDDDELEDENLGSEWADTEDDDDEDDDDDDDDE